MPMRDQPSSQTRIWRHVAIGCLVAFVVMDLFPWHGAPYFRYTGSDPAYPVWNSGWPLALAIYDSRSGTHIRLFPFVAVLVLLFVCVAVHLIRYVAGI